MATAAATSIPEQMKAEVIDHFGTPDDLHPATLPVPDLADDDVLIRVATAGVGVWDPELVGGEFADAVKSFPLVPGSDGAGTVVASGPRARRFQVGDRVYAWGFLNPKGGFFAEYAVLPEDEVATIPVTLDPGEAGGLAVDGLTALAGLELLEIAQGTKLMILGASGGVGHLALQLAKRMGAEVFAVASGKDGVELTRRLGADRSVDGRTDDVAAEARGFAAEGFDAALVLAGGNGWARELGSLKPAGRVAYPNGVEPQPIANVPSSLVQAYDGAHGREALDRLNRWIGMGPFHVEVSRSYALDQAPQALRDVTGHHLGKLAIHVP